MKKLLIGMLFISSSAFANPFFINSAGKPKINASYIKNELRSMWEEAEKPSYEQLAESITKKDRSYVRVATCTLYAQNYHNEVFYAGIALGLVEKKMGPFKEDVISFNYLVKRETNWLEFSSEKEVASNLYRINYYTADIVDYLDDKDGVNFVFEGNAPVFKVKMITNPRGLKDVSYLIIINNLDIICIL